MERVLLVDNRCQCIDWFAVDKDFQFLQFVGTIFKELIIE